MSTDVYTECCGHEPYQDSMNGQHYCSLCDARVDPASGERIDPRSIAARMAEERFDATRCETRG